MAATPALNAYSASSQSFVFHSAATLWFSVVVAVSVWVSFSRAVTAPEARTSMRSFFSHTPPAPASTASLVAIVSNSL